MIAADANALRVLYGRNPHPDDDTRAAMRRQLVELGDGLAAQLAELERDFTDERADHVVRNLHGAAMHIRRLSAMEVAR